MLLSNPIIDWPGPILSSVLCGVGVLISYRLYRRHRFSLSDIPGPTSSSFVLGNLPELFQDEVGDPEFKWHEEFGTVLRYKGCFGEDQLLISDPKTLQHIYTPTFQRLPFIQAAIKIAVGRGVLAVDGDDHRRQRKVLQPAFSAPHIKALFSHFSRGAEHLARVWKEIIRVDGQSVLDISSWLSRATLDILGDAAFDYQFGCLENDSNELARLYHDLSSNRAAHSSRTLILLQFGIFNAFPAKIIDYFLPRLPIKRFKESNHILRLTTNVARTLIDSKLETRKQGLIESKDIMNVLINANGAASKDEKMADDEVLAQMTTMMFAGHETTAKTLSWGLWELAKYPELQPKLRAEIKATRANALARGNIELTANDLDHMPLLAAITKEVFRYHPVAHLALRIATEDSVLPLSKPMKTLSGKYITQIPIREGQTVAASVGAYQRSKEIWGEDADVFRPERWLENAEKKATLGVYGNLMAFGTGYRPCIGWRFSVLEIQVLLIELIESFEFSIPPGSKRVIREPVAIMSPIVEGESEKGTQLPLLVRLVE